MNTFPVVLFSTWLIACAFILTDTKVIDSPNNAPVVCPTGPEGPNDTAVLIPNPLNCSTYFICANGVPTEMACRDDLLFNPILLVCDWKENVKCEIDGLMPALIKCYNEGGRQLFVNPRNCSTYWVCDSHGKGYAYLENCPPGLQFNKNLQDCDWPQNVKCVDHI